MNNNDANPYSQWKVEVMPICQLENVDVIKCTILKTYRATHTLVVNLSIRRLHRKQLTKYVHYMVPQTSILNLFFMTMDVILKRFMAGNNSNVHHKNYRPSTGQYKKGTKTMTFNNAKNLHNEDEVTIKETREHMCVLDAYVNPNNPKQVLIECDDGNTYTHHEIK